MITIKEKGGGKKSLKSVKRKGKFQRKRRKEKYRNQTESLEIGDKELNQGREN